MTSPSRPLRLLALWGLLLVFALGLGYQGVQRYDVQAAGGMQDVSHYYEMVQHGAGGQPAIWTHRSLLPLAARPIYRAIDGHTANWNPVYTSLLLVNAPLTALAALFVYLIGVRLVSPAAGLIGALLYLLNFEVANFLVTGLVDSLQAATLAGLVWLLLRRDWPWAVALVFIGAAGKETTGPLLAVVVVAWVLVTRRDLGWAAAALLAAVAGSQLMPLLVNGQFSNLFTVAESQRRQTVGGLASAFARCVTSWNLWLTIGWALPFLWLERARFPRTVLAAAGLGVAATIVLGTWSNAGENVARPVFGLAGPVLCLAAAAALLRQHPGQAPAAAATR